MADSLHKLDQQTFARLTRSIVCNEFTVDRILCGLRIARDLERDGVIRVRAKIVADQLHRIRSKDRVSKFRAACFTVGASSPGIVMLLRTPLAMMLPSLRQAKRSLLLESGPLCKPRIQPLKRAFTERKWRFRRVFNLRHRGAADTRKDA